MINTSGEKKKLVTTGVTPKASLDLFLNIALTVLVHYGFNALIQD